jgi:hypothetical protein
MIVALIFISIRLIFIAIRFVIITNRQEKTFSSGKKEQPPTAVLRYCEKSAKLTFIFRKKFYLSRKKTVSKFAISASNSKLKFHISIFKIEIY